MPTPQPHITRSTRSRSIVAACATMVCALSICVPLATAKTIEFQSTEPAAPAAVEVQGQGLLGGTSSIPLGTTKNKLVIRTNKLDREALKDHRTALGLEELREESIATTNSVSNRIEAIEQLLQQAETERDDLQAQVEARLVEQYQNGEAGSIAFMLGGGASEILDRARTLNDTSKRDMQLFDRLDLTLDRLQELRAVLLELQAIEGERTEHLGERIDRLGQSLVDARGARHATSLPVLKADKGESEAQDKGANSGDGTWYIMGGAFQAGIFMPGITGMGTGQYDGGTLTPREAPTPDIIGMVLMLNQKGTIELTPNGANDVSSGQIDNRVLKAMILASQRFGHIRVSMLKTGHGIYTAGGNISEHSYGCAMDIGTIGSTYIQASAQTPGGEIEAAVKFFAGLTGNLAPHQVISLFSLGGPTLAMSDHGDHIHVGYNC